MFSSRAFRAASSALRQARMFSTRTTAKPWHVSRLLAASALLSGVGFYSISKNPRSDEGQSVGTLGDPLDNKQEDDEAQTIDLVICKTSDLVEGVPRSVQIGENKDNFIVVAVVSGEVFAVSGKCPHYGANLAQGFLDGYTLYCPWHSAAFDIRSGEMTNGPAINSLTRYKVKVTSTDDVVVTFSKDRLQQVALSKVSSRLATRDYSNTKTFLIIGGGAAGLSAAETLRKEGFTGRVVVLTKESVLPYERVLLSKNFRTESSKFTLRPNSFFDEYDIDIMLDSEVVEVNHHAKVVTLADGSVEAFDKVLVATGCSPKVPHEFVAAAAELKKVCTIRSAADYDKATKYAYKADSLVIVGASLLGLETATAFKRAYPGKTVTVVDRSAAPLVPIFGKEIAEQLLDVNAQNGIRILRGVTVKAVGSYEGSFTGLTIEIPDEFRGPRTEVISGQALILATGAEVHAEFLHPSLLDAHGAVKVTSHLQTDCPDVYAAGDIASYFSLLVEAHVRVEHWSAAQNMGISAACNMLDGGDHFMATPFYWTNQFGNAQAVGFPSHADWRWTETKGGPSASDTAHITYFYKGNRPVGVATINSPGTILRLKVALEKDLMPTKEELEKGGVTFAEISARVSAASKGRSESCMCMKPYS